MQTIRLPARTVRRLRDELVREDQQERFAFLYAGEEQDLLASQVDPVPDDKMAVQSRTACRPAPEVERNRISDCYEQELVPVLTHSHPFSECPQFSSIDVESMSRFREWLTELFPDRSFGFAVVGTHDIELVANDESRLQAIEIETIGEWKLDEPVPSSHSRFALTDTAKTDGESPSEPSESSRFDRNIRAFGQEGQRRLQEATFGIVGVGGLGSMVAEQLARLGVEDIVLVDDDIVEESNLPRLSNVYEHHIGRPKVEALREGLWQSGTEDIDVEPVESRVQDAPAALDRCDVVVGCVDSVTARSFCNEYAVKHLTYYVDAGVRIDTTDDQGVEMTGYVHLVAPGSNACFDCLGRHDQAAARIEQMSPVERSQHQERGYIDADELTPEPAVIHLNGQCASKTVSVLVDLVTGRNPPPDFIRYEDHEHEMSELTTEPSDACPTCGSNGVLGVGRRSFGDAQFEPAEMSAESD